jgi:hypothetical protein
MKPKNTPNCGTIQQTCGFAPPTAQEMKTACEAVEKAWPKFWKRRNLPEPHVSKYNVTLDTEALEVAEC